MSAPGADPLAAIRQERYARIEAARERVRIAIGIDDWDDRSTLAIDGLIAQWDTRESALRALVAQWKATAEASEELGYYARRDKSDAYEDCADALERLLSGPQP